MENIIEVRNVSFWYDSDKKYSVLKDISVDFKRGEFVGIIGPNGCGKSTFIRLLNGLLEPLSGEVLVGGLDTRYEKNLPSIRRKVGMVFQNPDSQLFASVVEEDVAFGLENLCLPRPEIRNRVDLALEQVGMSEYKLFPPHRLSGGQRQRVAIAGILAMEPECIILDEPTSMLDAAGKQEVLQAVKVLNDSKKITVIYVTHDMSEILKCNRLIALNGGEIAFNGTPQQFFADHSNQERAGVQLPPIKQLINDLNEAGISISSQINSPEELVEAICP